MIQQATEDYLKTIYVLSEVESPVSTSRLAEARQVSLSAVSNMIKRLADLNLVHYEKSRGVTLTAEGEKSALEVLRHHRLIELYLTEALGFSWDEVHEQAELLEHVISEQLEERIADVLGHPQFDPHGDPIPTKDGTVVASPTARLSSLPQGQQAVVSRVTESKNSDLLCYLARLGIVPGAEISVVDVAPFDGPLTLQIDNEYQIVDHKIAEIIQVQTIHKTELTLCANNE